MTTTLPVREMVLYKSGVGFFRREGALDGTELALTFRHDEINDVLKSLAVIDRGGGQVLGLHYQTPMDREARLATTSIDLSDSSSVTDLLRGLRGRLVAFTVSGETLQGQVVGVEVPQFGSIEHLLEETLVSVLMDGDQVRVFPLAQMQSVQLLDELAAHDLRYFLETVRGEDVRRTVNVRLSDGAHDLAVYYVAPSPTWRVSYRFIGETEKNATGGKGRLQGWGVFDNRLEEDLEDVRVTLVAGQPISFVYDLYASHIPSRPTVGDENRVALGPVEYRGGGLLGRIDNRSGVAASMEQAPNEAAGGAAKRSRAMAADAMSVAHFARVPEDMAQSVTAVAEGRESGEFFQYVVTSPVTVKRGESALVPILSKELSYSRELLYNGAKLPEHPVAALRFKNATGLTLERGPVTVIEDGEYRGEAIVPFTRADEDVYLPYAVELGVRVVEEAEHTVEIAGLGIEQHFLIYQEYVIESRTYKLENRTGKAVTVLIEAPVRGGWELVDTAAPVAETATERRWQVDVPKDGRIDFVRRERQMRRRHQELRNLDYQALQRFMENRWLDEVTFEALSEMLDALADVYRMRESITQLETERVSLYTEQEQLRANLGALQGVGEEARLRGRLLAQFEASQDRLEAIAREMASLKGQIDEAEARIAAIIRGLG